YWSEACVWKEYQRIYHEAYDAEQLDNIEVFGFSLPGACLLFYLLDRLLTDCAAAGGGGTDQITWGLGMEFMETGPVYRTDEEPLPHSCITSAKPDYLPNFHGL